eukprot:3941220-Rhodomonas_salina.2
MVLPAAAASPRRHRLRRCVLYCISYPPGTGHVVLSGSAGTGSLVLSWGLLLEGCESALSTSNGSSAAQVESNPQDPRPRTNCTENAFDFAARDLPRVRGTMSGTDLAYGTTPGLTL